MTGINFFNVLVSCQVKFSASRICTFPLTWENISYFLLNNIYYLLLKILRYFFFFFKMEKVNIYRKKYLTYLKLK